MRTRISALMAKELCDTFSYRSISLADVNDGFVRKPSLPFVLEIEVNAGQERVVEGQNTRFTTGLN